MQQAPATEARRGDLPALAELVARMSSSLEPDEVLDHAIEVCAELTGCQGALVYLWDDEHEHLAVRGASEGYRQWVGRFALAAGEGLTGWTAETRQVGIITDHPQDDPRYLHVPDLNDERFQSVATVPVVGRSDQLLGVLTLHTRAPREFTDQDVTLLRAIAGLVAAAVENAQLHQRALRSVEVFRRLAELSRQLTSASSTARTLQLLAMTTRELLAGDLAAVLQLDESRGRLAVETWAGSGGLRTEPIPAEGPWAQLLGGGPVSVDLGGEPDLSLTAGARSLFAAPLRLEGRPTGLLLCYSVESRSLGGDNLELLGTIANHTSIALEEGRRRDAAAQRTRVRELFDALRAGELRDLGGPHAVVVVETQPTEDAERVWGPLAVDLGAQFGGTRVDARPQSLRALVPIASATWAPRLAALIESHMVAVDGGAGISQPAERDYALAFRQAEIAAAIAGAGGDRRVREYADLGAQRHLWTIAREGEADPLEAAVTRLSEIDAKRGSQLFRTLEVYLEHQGNARKASAALFIHRNTLRQRLRRISDLIGIDVRDRSTWFDLGLAVRLVRFRGTAGKLLGGG
jgi:GAF domain-containing protein